MGSAGLHDSQLQAWRLRSSGSQEFAEFLAYTPDGSVVTGQSVVTGLHNGLCAFVGFIVAGRFALARASLTNVVALTAIVCGVKLKFQPGEGLDAYIKKAYMFIPISAAKHDYAAAKTCWCTPHVPAVAFQNSSCKFLHL